jgi:hypothetical protein
MAKVYRLPTSAITHNIKILSNNAKNIKTVDEEIKAKNLIFKMNEEGMIYAKYERGNKEMCVFGLKPLDINARKTLDFILIQANKQHYPETIYFELEDYMQYRGITSKDYAYKQLDKAIDIIRKIVVEEYKKTNKSHEWESDLAFKKGKISYDRCFVHSTRIVRDVLCQYYTIYPHWIGKLNKNAYNLATYIFDLARQKLEDIVKDNSFTIKLKTVSDNLGLKPEQTKHHKQLIIEPIRKAILEINETSEEQIKEIKTLEDTKKIARGNEEIKIYEVHKTEEVNAKNYKQILMKIDNNISLFLKGQLEIFLSPDIVELITPKAVKQN